MPTFPLYCDFDFNAWILTLESTKEAKISTPVLPRILMDSCSKHEMLGVFDGQDDRLTISIDSSAIEGLGESLPQCGDGSLLGQPSLKLFPPRLASDHGQEFASYEVEVATKIGSLAHEVGECE